MSENSKIIEKAKNEFHQMIDNNGSDPYGLLSHIEELEKWAKFMLKKNPNLDKEVVMLAVFLHDIGHYPINKEMDHAVSGEKIAKNLLEKWDFNKLKIPKVLHCIRAHRCKDVMPETNEAKLMACIDSASHMTDILYIDMATEGRADEALAKLDRDFRDLSNFPEIKDKLKNMYTSWKQLLNDYKKIHLED
jgi:HD superfamily phosphodiesterase